MSNFKQSQPVTSSFSLIAFLQRFRFAAAAGSSSCSVIRFPLLVCVFTVRFTLTYHKQRQPEPARAPSCCSILRVVQLLAGKEKRARLASAPHTLSLSSQRSCSTRACITSPRGEVFRRDYYPLRCQPIVFLLSLPLSVKYTP